MLENMFPWPVQLLFWVGITVLFSLKVLTIWRDNRQLKAHFVQGVVIFFRKEGQTVTEFRIKKIKRERIFEVRTIQHKYYRVKTRRTVVVSVEPTDTFKISETEWCVKGLIDECDLNRYRVEIRS